MGKNFKWQIGISEKTKIAHKGRKRCFIGYRDNENLNHSKIPFHMKILKVKRIPGVGEIGKL